MTLAVKWDLKEIGKQINLTMFENIQGVMMNAHKNTTQQALLCTIPLSTHNWQESGNNITFDSLSHTSCEEIHWYLDFKAIVS